MFRNGVHGNYENFYSTFKVFAARPLALGTYNFYELQRKERETPPPTPWSAIQKNTLVKCQKAL